MTVSELIAELQKMPGDLVVELRVDHSTSEIRAVAERPMRYWRPGMPPPVVPNRVTLSDGSP